MIDAYEGGGEFHDLFMTDVWGGLRPALASAFAGLDAGATIVDVGAGTAIGTRLLAASTAAQVVAIKPLTKNQASRDLPDKAPDRNESQADSGFVCAHMLGHLTATGRQETFARLATLLEPGGIGIITLPRTSASHGTNVVEEATQIGRHRYLARHWSTPDGRGSQSEFLVLDGDRIVRRQMFASSWEPPTLEQLHDELNDAGLHLVDADERIDIVRHAEAVA